MSFFGDAEKLFWDNAADGWDKAKKRAKPKIHNVGIGWLGVKPDEVISKLERIGVKITRRTLLNYEKFGLIPEPKRSGAGKGKGRTTDYPDETPAEAFAAYCLLHDHGAEGIKVKPEWVASIRQKVKERGDFSCEKSYGGLTDDFLATLWIIRYTSAQIEVSGIRKMFKEKYNIDAHNIEIVIDSKEKEFIEISDAHKQQRKHGDVRITSLSDGTHIFEYWNANEEAWIKFNT